MPAQRRTRKSAVRTSWEPVADWYTSWVGEAGGRHHRKQTIPAALELLLPGRGESVIDIGAGPGVLAPHIAAAGARYTGVDASRRMLQFARKHHGRHGRFLLGDAARLQQLPGIQAETFDAAVFLLSIQDMDPLPSVIEAMAWALRGGGRVVMVMTHPCFRVPRLSGWGWDERRDLQFRRVDRYLTALPVPVETAGGEERTATVRFHRPLQDYINSLAAAGFAVDRMQELPSHKADAHDSTSRAERRALEEIPMFLALRAWKGYLHE